MSAYAREAAEVKSLVQPFSRRELIQVLRFAGRATSGNKKKLLDRVEALLSHRQPGLFPKIREIYWATRRTFQDDCVGGRRYTATENNNFISIPGIFRPRFLQRSARKAPVINSLRCVEAGQILKEIQPSDMRFVNVRFENQPFVHNTTEIIKPIELDPQTHGTQIAFTLTSDQKSLFAPLSLKNFDIVVRFCALRPEQSGQPAKIRYPPGLAVLVNGKRIEIPESVAEGNKWTLRQQKPLSILEFCKDSLGMKNIITIHWPSLASANQSWVLGVCIVEKLTADDLLVHMLTEGKFCPSDNTKTIIQGVFEEKDEVALAELQVSLICPLGKTRIKFPCRFSLCDHLQCFDAVIFLKMNELNPTWTCPVCGLKSQVEKLQIDHYFLDILTSPAISEQQRDIVINENGSWNTPKTSLSKDTDIELC